jgi:hypothetical protein
MPDMQRRSRQKDRRGHARWAALALLFCTTTSGAETIDVGGGAYAVDGPDVPADVLAAVTCDHDGLIFRQPFLGMVIFRARCPGNNQNYIENLVRAEDDAGTGATAVLFPSGGEPTADISNVRLFEATPAIGEIRVDTEHGAGQPCLFETLYRLEDWTARLVFQRRSLDCERTAATRWEPVLDERTDAERALDWQ